MRWAPGSELARSRRICVSARLEPRASVCRYPSTLNSTDCSTPAFCGLEWSYAWRADAMLTAPSEFGVFVMYYAMHTPMCLTRRCASHARYGAQAHAAS